MPLTFISNVKSSTTSFGITTAPYFCIATPFCVAWLVCKYSTLPPTKPTASKFVSSVRIVATSETSTPSTVAFNCVGLITFSSVAKTIAFENG